MIKPTTGLTDFKLYKYQKRYVEHIAKNRLSIGKKFRQGGFTTLSCAIATWKLLFKLDEHNLMIGMGDRASVELNYIVRRFVAELPDFLRPNFSRINDHRIENDEIGSSLKFGCHLIAPNIANYFLDECAFWPKENVGCLPQIYDNIKRTQAHCTILSSTNGKNNWFYETYLAAIHGKNDYEPYFCDHLECPSPTEDKIKLLKDTLGDKGWRQEYLMEFI